MSAQTTFSVYSPAGSVFTVSLPSDATVRELKDAVARELKEFVSAITLSPHPGYQFDRYAYCNNVGSPTDEQLAATAFALSNAAVQAMVNKRVQSQFPNMGKSAATKLQHQLYSATGSNNLSWSVMKTARAFKHISEVSVKAAETVETIALLLTSSKLSAISIKVDGEELQAYRLLPKEGGVEFRGVNIFSWIGPTLEDTEKHMQQLEKYNGDIAHCRKLLRDLPVALQNSESALWIAAKAEEVDLTELGAIVMEQLRIKQEIDTQKELLPKLLQVPPPACVAPVNFVPRQMQSKLLLPFGRHVIDGIEYLVAPMPEEVPAEPSAISVADVEMIQS
jgi:hypothetical protein